MTENNKLRVQITEMFWAKAKHGSGSLNGGADTWTITKSDFNAYADNLQALMDATIVEALTNKKPKPLNSFMMRL